MCREGAVSELAVQVTGVVRIRRKVCSLAMGRRFCSLDLTGAVSTETAPVLYFPFATALPIVFVGADAERSCSRRRSVTDAACPLRVLIGLSSPQQIKFQIEASF